MNQELFSIIALAARYWFCALMMVIVFRAWRITITDNRRAAKLRAWSPTTGCIGEFVINPGRGKSVNAVPVPREGMLGSSRRADIHIAAKDVRRFHLNLEQREGGLLVTPLGKAEVLLNGELKGKSLFVRDGDTLTIGKTRLLYVQFEPDAQSAKADEFTDEALWLDYDQPTSAKGAPEKKTPRHNKPASLPPSARKRRTLQSIEEFEDELWPDD